MNLIPHLRVGNYFMAKSPEKQEWEGSYYLAPHDIILAFQGKIGLKPIPLSVEWMTRLGFEAVVGDGEQKYYLDASPDGLPQQRFDIYWGKSGLTCKSRYQEDHPWYFMSHIKHVHELQNLYFALTGGELVDLTGLPGETVKLTLTRDAWVSNPQEKVTSDGCICGETRTIPDFRNNVRRCLSCGGPLGALAIESTSEEEEDSMDIYAEEGTKVKYTGKNGLLQDKEHADKHLKAGEIYTVDCTHVQGWHTDVYLKEVPLQSFNSVHFVNA